MSEKKDRENFLIYNRCEKAKWLRRKYPNAYLLLSVIAESARRYNGLDDGLIIGDALIGDYEEAGLSRQQFRTALQKLVNFKIVKIISNGKSFFEREKSTIKITIEGHLVNLLDSTIWDINPEHFNHQINQRSTNDQPTINHKQEKSNTNHSYLDKDNLIPKDIARTDLESANFSQSKVQHNLDYQDISLKCPKTASPLRTDIFFCFDIQEFQNITEKEIASWKETYPAADISQSLLRMREWILSNPTKSKTKKNWRKFISNWLLKTNDETINKQAYKANNHSRAVMNGKHLEEYDKRW